jgi:hypothetical protein
MRFSSVVPMLVTRGSLASFRRSKYIVYLMGLLVVIFFVVIFSIGLFAATPLKHITSNSSIMQESTLDDEAVKGYATEHWLFNVIAYTADRAHSFKFGGWLDRGGDTEGSMRLDDLVISTIKPSGPVVVSDKRPSNISIEQGGWKFTLYSSQERIAKISGSSSGYNYLVTIDAHSRGLPMWLARTELEMVVAGRDANGTMGFVGGFGDAIDVEITLVSDLYNLNFTGYGVYVHWWTNHFPSYVDWINVCVQDSNFYTLIFHSWNPITKERYVHAGFLGFPASKEYYSFDNYEVTYDINVTQPFVITGSYPGGTVNLTGTAVYESFWMRWSGTITLHGNAITVTNADSGPEVFQNIKYRKTVSYFAVDCYGEKFTLAVTDQKTIQDCMDNMNGFNSLFPYGKVDYGDGGFNKPWSWHLIPDTVRMVENAIELSDGSPSGIESNLDYWINTVKYFGPWGGKIVGVA